MTDTIKFDAPKNASSIIKVIGVGGGGSNAVNYMFKQGIQGVDFIVCNTDAKALLNSPVPVQIQLGINGLGAGNNAEEGRQAAMQTKEQIAESLSHGTEMLFVTAGMGGGTGTGAAPVVASVAREMGILTVAIVTIPFSFEGKKRFEQAQEGIKELRKHVDSLLIISNDKLRELYGDLSLSEAFSKADNVLTTAAKGIAEIITVDGYVNIDFKDVKAVMEDSGVAFMASGTAEGDRRAIEAAKQALESPLLNDNDISGASNILLYISSGNVELKMSEVEDIIEYIQREAGSNADIIWGNCVDNTLDDKISITLVATGFRAKENLSIPTDGKTKITVHDLNGNDIIKKEEEVVVAEPEPKAIFVEEKCEMEKVFVDEENNSMDLYSEIQPQIVAEVIVNTPEKSDNQVYFNLYDKNEVKDSSSDKSSDDNTMKLISKKPENSSTNNQFHTLEQEPQTNFPEENKEKFCNPQSNKRIEMLRALSIKLSTKEGLEEIENIPAYIRGNVELTDIESSDKSSNSRMSLFDDNGNIGIRNENTFIHDKADWSMSLLEIINNDIKNAMLAREKDKLESLRAVKAALLVAQTEKGASSEISEQTEIQLLKRLVKQRKESAEIYKSQNRKDLEDVELSQLSYIEKYLPAQMNEEELENVVKAIIAEQNITSLKDMGKVIGIASKQLAGKADNKIISDIVKKLLS